MPRWEEEEGDPSKYSRHDIALRGWGELDVRMLLLAVAKGAVKRRPLLVSLWALGLLLAALAGGFPVDDTAKEAYSMMLQQAEVIESRTLGQQALVDLERAEREYYGAKGWFGACDDRCVTALDKAQLARAQVAKVQQHRDQVLAEARREVGIWSVFGVQDVRRSFWSAWKSGKDFAARCTMYDALFMMAGRDEALMAMALKLVVQYVVNLTMGLIGAFFFFMYNLYCLIVSYGSSVLSGLVFFLLAGVTGLSLVSTYIGGVCGVVAGGGILLVQHAEAQAAIEAGRRGGRRERLPPAPCNEKDIV